MERQRLNYKMVTREVGSSRTFEEELSLMETSDVTPMKSALRIVMAFNKSLKPGEKKRRLISATHIEESEEKMKHLWEKKSLVTEKGGYDLMRCMSCGVIGKRYGLGQRGVTTKKGQEYCKGTK